MNRFSKKQLLVAGGVATILVVALLVSYFLRRSQPGYVREYTDKDTSEIVSITPNTTTESVNSEKKVDILGAASLYEIGASGLSSNQLPLFSEDLIENGILALGDYDETVKIVNPSYDYNTSELSASLFYKTGQDPARIAFSLPGISTFSYRIIVGDQTVYESGLLTVVDDIGDNYTGDGVPPEEQPF